MTIHKTDLGGGSSLIGGDSIEEIRAAHYPADEWFAIGRILVRNVPDPKPGWEKVDCEGCGEPCWKRPDIEPNPQPPRTYYRCTACLLRIAASGKGSKPR